MAKNINLQKINQGDSGLIAAKKIIDNDQLVQDQVDSIKQELDANKAYAAMISGGTGTTLVQVKQDIGTSITDIMSQSATTREINRIDDDIYDMAMVTDIDVDTADPIPSEINADYALKAATDMEGHSLVTMYNDLQTVKTNMLYLGNVIETIQVDI